MADHLTKIRKIQRPIIRFRIVRFFSPFSAWSTYRIWLHSFLGHSKNFKVWITIMKDQVYFWLRDKSGRMWNELVDLPTVRSMLFVRCCFLWGWRTTDSYGVKSMYTYVICTEISWCIFISAPILLWIGVFLINRLFYSTLLCNFAGGNFWAVLQWVRHPVRDTWTPS